MRSGSASGGRRIRLGRQSAAGVCPGRGRLQDRQRLRRINGYRSQEMDVRCSAIHAAIHTVTRPSAIQVPKNQCLSQSAAFSPSVGSLVTKVTSPRPAELQPLRGTLGVNSSHHDR